MDKNSKRIPDHVRETALENADYSCRVCPARGKEVGGDATLHLHHRKSPLKGGTHELDNLVVLCADCHHHHHSGRPTADDLETSLPEAELDATPADYKLIHAISEIAPATTGELAEKANISDVHALRRLYALAAVDMVSMTTNREWDLAERVEDSLRGKLPDNPERAARVGRDYVIKNMIDYGLKKSEVAAIVGLDERTIPVAVNRARAFDPPVPASSSTPDLADIECRVASLERQLDSD